MSNLWPWVDLVDEEGAYAQCRTCGTCVITPPPDECQACASGYTVEVYELAALEESKTHTGNNPATPPDPENKT